MCPHRVFFSLSYGLACSASHRSEHLTHLAPSAHLSHGLALERALPPPVFSWGRFAFVLRSVLPSAPSVCELVHCHGDGSCRVQPFPDLCKRGCSLRLPLFKENYFSE